VAFNKLSIIIPVFNEEKTIEEVVNTVLSVDVLGLKKELIIVDDGSTDRTAEILAKIVKKNIKIFTHDQNQGKGAALKTGFNIATGDIVLIQDADLEYDPKDYQKMLKPIIDKKASVVFGSRFVGGNPHRVLYFWHYIANKVLTTFSNMLTNLNLTDMEVCYKVFTKDVIESITPKLESSGFGIEAEITAYVTKLKVPIYEVGISYYGRTYEEGKKINWKDGFITLWKIIKYNIFR
jgi:glycosyltransferase involved in cell wall biosynthesis